MCSCRGYDYNTFAGIVFPQQHVTTLNFKAPQERDPCLCTTIWVEHTHSFNQMNWHHCSPQLVGVFYAFQFLLRIRNSWHQRTCPWLPFNNSDLHPHWLCSQFPLTWRQSERGRDSSELIETKREADIPPKLQGYCINVRSRIVLRITTLQSHQEEEKEAYIKNGTSKNKIGMETDHREVDRGLQ